MQEISLYDLLKFYSRRWFIIIAITLLGLLGGLSYNKFVQKPLYKSSATLLVVNKSAASSSDKTTAINNNIELLKSRLVLETVISKLQLDQSYEELVSSVSTSNDKDTEVIKLNVSTANAERSKKIVEAMIEAVGTQVTRLNTADTLRVIDNANLAERPYNVRKTIQLGLATIAGFLLSLIVVFIMYDYALSKLNTSKGKQVTTLVVDDKPHKKYATIFVNKIAHWLKFVSQQINKLRTPLPKPANKQQSVKKKPNTTKKKSAQTAVKKKSSKKK